MKYYYSATIVPESGQTTFEVYYWDTQKSFRKDFYEENKRKLDLTVDYSDDSVWVYVEVDEDELT